MAAQTETTTQAAQELVDRHADLLDRAVEATRSRTYLSAFPESPSPRVYGEEAAAAGEAAFTALRDRRFALDQAGQDGWTGAEVSGGEVSPYGPKLGITYPTSDLDVLLPAMKAALPAWRDAGPQVRAAVAIEILTRINAQSFTLAHAVQHTTGQPFVMAFQAAGPHAQDRGLEAVAYTYAEQTRHARAARWTKPSRKGDDTVLDKTFTPVPRGLALVIACSTFPTWNGYPGLFASLVAGNPVMVKPHPAAVLPLALTVRVAREVLAEAGFSADLVTLVVDRPDAPVAADLATHPDVRVVDFTGSSDFGSWLEANATQAFVCTEKAGLNTVVLDATDDYRGLLANLAFSLSLYSGQMCTTPQNLLVPESGVGTPDGPRTPDEFAADLGQALDRLLADPARATAILGAVANDGVAQRITEAAEVGRLARPSASVAHPEFPDARVRSPLVARLSADDAAVYTTEWFGPISFVISTESTAHSLEVLRGTVQAHGALTAAVYATDEEVLDATRRAAMDAGVHLSENLTKDVYVNQTAAFSDFHGSAANPAATASLTDPAFVSGRFSVMESRRHA